MKFGRVCENISPLITETDRQRREERQTDRQRSDRNTRKKKRDRDTKSRKREYTGKNKTGETEEWR